MDTGTKKLLEQLGKEIQGRRQRLNWTQMKLAEASSLHRTYIADIERGRRNVSFVNLCCIATALGISLSDLLKNTDTTLRKPY